MFDILTCYEWMSIEGGIFFPGKDLRQLSKDHWQTCYYDEVEDYFYSGSYFNNIEDAYQEFHIQLNQHMKRYEHFVSMFFKYRSYITSQETEEESESLVDYSKGVNWQDAEDDLKDFGVVIKFINNEWCAVSSRDNAIYYTAKSKEELITYYFNGDMSDYR